MVAAGPDILIVDDNDDLREMMAECLRRGFKGLCVTAVSSGHDALAELARQPGLPRLVVMDLDMPVMNGEQFLNILRSYSRLARVPVLIVSGAPRDRLDRLRVVYGVEYLVKPFDNVQLCERVTAYLGRHVT